MTISPNKWELDVQGYLNVCNITTATPRKQIRDFSAGVNDLGLWNSMVCWPLRSSQNYGSGTTAFSLGGLGTYNGLLVGGPTWAVDGSGVTFTIGVAQGISTGLTGNHANQTVMAFANLAEISTNNYRLIAPQNGGYDGDLMLTTSAGIAEWRFGLSFAPVLAGQATTGWSTFAGAKTGFTFTGTINAASASTTVETNTSVAIGIGGSNRSDTTFPGTIAAALYVSSHIAASAVQNLRTLYKSTLGTGLSLP
jgi:hypothetical protein